MLWTTGLFAASLVLSVEASAGKPKPPAPATVQPAPAPPPLAPALVPAPQRLRLGVWLEPVSDVLATQLGLPAGTGLVVADVDPAGPAARAGVQRHDVLVAVGGKPAAPGTVHDALTALQPGAGLTVEVVRAGRPVAVEVVPEPGPVVAVPPRPDLERQLLSLEDKLRGALATLGTEAEQAARAAEDAARDALDGTPRSADALPY